MGVAAASAALTFAGSHDAPASLPQRLQQALMTWQHPSAAMPGGVVAAVAASKQGAGFLEERRALWREAFRSLYMAVQSGLCHCFYFLIVPVSAPLCLLPGSSFMYFNAGALPECTFGASGFSPFLTERDSLILADHH